MLDVIIIGGSYAGLSAALQLARARRRILIVDGGERRNRFTRFRLRAHHTVATACLRCARQMSHAPIRIMGME